MARRCGGHNDRPEIARRYRRGLGLHLDSTPLGM